LVTAWGDEGGVSAVSNDNIVQLIQPGSFSDPLTAALRNGARSLLAKAVEAEVAACLARRADLKREDGTISTKGSRRNMGCIIANRSSIAISLRQRLLGAFRWIEGGITSLPHRFAPLIAVAFGQC
jgi:hypothetical protein